MQFENLYKKEKSMISLGTILKHTDINNSEQEKKKKKNEVDLESNGTEQAENMEEIEKEPDEENKEKEKTAEKENIENVEFHKLYESDDNVSRSSVNIDNKDNSHNKKKTKVKLNALMVQSYIHKSYDKVSNALKKTSKSFLKKSNISSGKKINIGNPILNNNKEFTSSKENLDKNNSDENYLFGINSDIINKYLENNIDLEKNNEKLLKKFQQNLENNDTSKFLEELKDLLDEKILLIKYLINFKTVNSKCIEDLNKYRNSLEILKSENEQLNQNIITLKSYIDFLSDTNTQSNLKKEDNIDDLNNME